MTIIYTAAFPGVVVQASDRLITKKRNTQVAEYRPHDPASNKSVVYCGSNCKLLLGYTGAAYVADVPTDLWMTKKLWGSNIHDLANFGFRQPGLARNADEVVRLFANASDMPSNITISIGGYQRTRRGDVPRFWIVQRGKATLEPPDVLLDRGFSVMTGIEIPSGWSRSSEQQELIQALTRPSGSDWKNIRAALVRYVQNIAEHADAVGGDVLIVAIDKNDRFISTSLHLSDGSAVEAGMTYIPSAIFPGVLIPPARILNTRLSIIAGPGYIKSPPGLTQNRHEFMFVQNLMSVPSLNAAWFDHTRRPPPTKW